MSPLIRLNEHDILYKCFFSNLWDLFQAIRLRNVLNYFDVLDAEEPWGHMHVERISPPTEHRSKKGRRQEEDDLGELSKGIGDFPSSKKPLTPIYVTHERRGVDLQSNSHSVTLGMVS